MLPALGRSPIAHGATGTWLDELIELGLPIILFVALYFWSNRKSRRKSRAKPGDAEREE